MPPKAATARQADLEDELLQSDTENGEQTPVINRTVIKKPTKARATAATKMVAKKPSAKAAATAAAKPKAPRRTLKDGANPVDGSGSGSGSDSDNDGDDDADAAVADAAPAKGPSKAGRARTAKAKAGATSDAPTKKAARASKAPVQTAARDGDEIPDSQAPKPRKPRTVKRAPSPERSQTIAETQPDPGHLSQAVEGAEAETAAMDTDADVDMDVDEHVDEHVDLDVDARPKPPPVQKAAPPARARSASQQRQMQPQPVAPRPRSTSVQPRSFSRSRAGSVSDTERRVAESDAKNKLRDMTRKYEDMRLKYDSLQDIVQNSAESNFDKLKRASDERAKDADKLIASLKREIAQVRKSSSQNTSETARLQSQVAATNAENEKLKDQVKTSQSALAEAQNEVKSLTAKLDAARKSVQAPADKVPGSAVKSHSLGRSQMGSNPEAAKHAALKEELYRDLTGLIINSVKRKDGEDEYSCIQTGRNGTLHFHLTVCNDSSMANPKTPSGLSYEDTEFAYEPVLDDDRDRDLVDILPDYLTEEICFPRNHAVKFYTKVVESMTRKIVVDEE